MADLRSPAGTVVSAEGSVVDRLLASGWTRIGEEPKRKPGRPRKATEDDKK